MKDTGFFLSEVDVSRLACSHQKKDDELVTIPQYGFPTYPDGLLRTSVLELARHLTSFINFGEFEQVRILKKRTVKEMRRVQYPDVDDKQGLAWRYIEFNDTKFLGHSGGDPGISTMMYFRVSDGVAVITFANASHINRSIYKEIFERLFQEADNF